MIFVSDSGKDCEENGPRAADLHAVVDWPQMLSALGVDDSYLTGKHGPCPGCGGKDRFRFTNHKRRGAYICSQCGSGDGFSLLGLVHDWSFIEALKEVARVQGIGPKSAPAARRAAQPRPATDEPKQEWSAKADAIWRRTTPLAGTVGETYLKGRGCLLPPSRGDLRFLPANGEHPPSLCARVTDVWTNAPLTLQFIRLAADGSGKSGVGKSKIVLSDHRMAGGVIRLWPDDEVTMGLAIAEGVETAMAAAHEFAPVWATIASGNMERFPALAGIETLTIYADNDVSGTGQHAARECVRRWNESGREVEVITPLEAGTDMADLAAQKICA